MDQALQRRLIDTVANTVIAHADELTRLDQAIGDGDHGLNMKRGLEAVLAELDTIAGKPEATAAAPTPFATSVTNARRDCFALTIMCSPENLARRGRATAPTSGPADRGRAD